MPLIHGLLLNKALARYATAYWLKVIVCFRSNSHTGLRGSHRLDQVCLMAALE